TWSTPESSSARQFSPSQLSASPWLPKASFGTSPELAAVPSVFSNRHDHTMSGPPPRASLAEPFGPALLTRGDDPLEPPRWPPARLLRPRAGAPLAHDRGAL